MSVSSSFKTLPESIAQLQPRLQAGCSALGLSVTDKQSEQLLTYIALIEKWNKAYNLTAIKSVDEMLGLHLLDSLSVAPHINQDRLIDVGTGAGLPGIPLAIVLPHKHFTLLDTNSKRTRFMLQAKGELGLDNISVVKSRVEAYQAEPKYDAVLSRAFASLIDMIQGCEHLLTQNGLYLAMKGLEPTEEYPLLPDSAKLVEVKPLVVPEVSAQRHLVVVQKDSLKNSVRDSSKKVAQKK